MKPKNQSLDLSLNLIHLVPRSQQKEVERELEQQDFFEQRFFNTIQIWIPK
jgi:hypothetical protein